MGDRGDVVPVGGWPYRCIKSALSAANKCLASVCSLTEPDPFGLCVLLMTVTLTGCFTGGPD